MYIIFTLETDLEHLALALLFKRLDICVQVCGGCANICGFFLSCKQV